MHHAKSIGISVCALMIFAGLSPAAPVNYNESVDGDLDQGNPPSFNLDIGNNVWTGNIGPTPTNNTADVFNAILPANMKITHIRWQYSANDGDVTNFGVSGPAAAAPPFGTLITHSVGSAAENILDSGFSGDNPPLPVTVAGSYNCSVSTGFAISQESWTITLTVEEVPIPVEPTTWGRIKTLY